MATRRSLNDQIYELQVELERNKKLLGQCIERQDKPRHWPSNFTSTGWNASQVHVDLVADDAMELAHSQYARIFWKFFWRKDFSL
jgi:hypothetical protein